MKKEWTKIRAKVKSFIEEEIYPVEKKLAEIGYNENLDIEIVNSKDTKKREKNLISFFFIKLSLHRF